MKWNLYRPRVDSLEDRLPPGSLLALGAGFEAGPVLSLSADNNLRPEIALEIDQPLESHGNERLDTLPVSEFAAQPIHSRTSTDTETLNPDGDDLAGSTTARPPASRLLPSEGSAPVPATWASWSNTAANAAALLRLPSTEPGSAVQPSSAIVRNDAVAVAAGRHSANSIRPLPHSPATLAKNYGQLPLRFQANVGQTDPRVQFLSAGNGSMLFLSSTEAVFRLDRPASDIPDSLGEIGPPSTAVIRMQLVGATPGVQGVGLEALPTRANYFLGNDPAHWHTNVPSYGRVAFPGVYPGIDLVYYGNQGQLEYDFVVAPGADPRAISLHFQGTQNVALDAAGSLVVQTAAGSIVQHRPVLYQIANGVRSAVAGSFILEGPNQVGVAVGRYDPTQPLVIDPTLAYSSYLGGSGEELALGLAVDDQGDMFVTGQTSSPDFPTTDGSTGDGLPHAFVAELDPTGTYLVFATYLGGSGLDRGNAIALDASGNIYVAGRTGSRDFPLVHPLPYGLRYPGGTYSGFVTKLSPAGASVVYSTYLGGSGNDDALGIAVNAQNQAYVVGGTSSDDFPTTPNAFQYEEVGTVGFLAKINAADSDLLYASYIGGDLRAQRANAVALDSAGNAYITGQTDAVDFPVTGRAAQQNFGGGINNAFVAKINPTRTGARSLIYSTYLGGSQDDRGLAIAVDADGNAYVTGETSSPDFPTVTAFQPTFQASNFNAFITKVDPTGSSWVFSSYFGGSGWDIGAGIALDGQNHIYLTGMTTSPDFPTVNAIQANFGGGNSDAFVAELSADGSGPLFSTFLGGGGDENPDDNVGHTGQHNGRIAVDSAGTIYVIGNTQSVDFPTVNPLQGNLNGTTNAFLVKIAP
jgi:hypothetical protein